MVENLLETKLQSEREKMELRWKEMEKEMKEKIQQLETRLESKDKEMERRLEEFKDNMKEEREAWIAKLRLEVDQSLMKSNDTNNSNTALIKPSLSNPPVLLISAWQPHDLRSPQTVTFESFLANYNSQGVDGSVLDLDSGVFSCVTPGYYTVSFSAYSHVGHSFDSRVLCLYKNGIEVAESRWMLSTHSSAVNDWIAVTGSRIVVSRTPLGNIPLKAPNFESLFSRFSTWMEEIPWS